MKVYADETNYKLYEGTMQEVLDTFEENSVDAIICDPPYELGFMGKKWDNTGVAFQKETWERCFKVLKPGGHLLAFGGTRTYHRIACAIEDAGFEIRDTMMWLYGSGFPKSMNISKGLEAKEKLGNASTRSKRKIEQSCNSEEYIIKQTNNGAMGEIIETTRKIYTPDTDVAKKWSGWGTALKPAYEPIIVARKPCEGSCIENVMKYDVGGINIDECRIKTEDDLARINNTDNGMFGVGNNNKAQQCKEQGIEYEGRFPANVITDGSDEVASGMPTENEQSAMRYFYQAKASKKDRDDGLEMFEEKQRTDGCIRSNSESGRIFGANSGLSRNVHPTVKPVELMQYLVRLVSPKGATILDCFMGSGSTGKAVMFENREREANYKFIGIEMTPEYLPICQARIEYAINKYEYDEKKKADDVKKETGQTSIYDYL